MVSKVFLEGDATDPDYSIICDHLRPLVADAIREEIDWRRALFRAEGFADNVPLAMMLSVPLDFLAMPPAIAAAILAKAPDEIVAMLTTMAKTVLLEDEDEDVTLIKVRFSIARMPSVPELLCISRQEFFAQSRVRMTSTGVNRPASRLREIQGTVLQASPLTTTVVARYIRCGNEECRASEPFQCYVAPISGGQRGPPGSRTPRCAHCREEAAERAALALVESMLEGTVLVSSWQKAITVRLAGKGLSIKPGESYRFWGHAEADWEEGGHYFRVLGSETATTSPMARQVVVSLSHFSHIGSCLSEVRHVRILQLFRLLIPTARILVLSEGDPWDRQICHALYGPGRVVVHELLDASLKRRPSAMLQDKSVLILASRELKKPRISMAPFDCILDRRRRDQAEDAMISSLLLQSGTTGISVLPTLPIPSCDVDAVRWGWSQEVKEMLQEYFVAFRELCGTLNDKSWFPLHQPARQLTLLTEAAEHAARFAGRGSIRVEDVAVAVLVGEMLLEQRYGQTVLGDADGPDDGRAGGLASSDASVGLMSPCSSVKGQRRSLRPMVHALRGALFI